MTPTAPILSAHPSDRGTGRTSKQMLDAPDGAVFIWCNDIMNYPQLLYRHLKKMKLIPETQRLFIKPRSVLLHSYQLRGLNGPVIFDHAITSFALDEYRGVENIKIINERYDRDKKIVEL